MASIFLSHLGLCSTGAHAHMPMSALLSTVSGFNKWKNKNERWTYPPSRTPGSEGIHWHRGGILSSPNSFATTSWKCRHLPFKPYSQLAPASLLILCPEVITMATWVLAGAGPSVTSARAQPWLVLSLLVPGQTSAEGAICSRLTMWSLKSSLCFSMGVTCVYALMFTSVTEKVKEIQGKMLCRGHFLIQQNPPEHAQDWLEITFSGFSSLCQCT